LFSYGHKLLVIIMHFRSIELFFYSSAVP